VAAEVADLIGTRLGAQAEAMTPTTWPRRKSMSGHADEPVGPYRDFPLGTTDASVVSLADDRAELGGPHRRPTLLSNPPFDIVPQRRVTHGKAVVHLRAWGFPQVSYRGAIRVSGGPSGAG
jgi:hypothetical protein